MTHQQMPQQTTGQHGQTTGGYEAGPPGSQGSMGGQQTGTMSGAGMQQGTTQQSGMSQQPGMGTQSAGGQGMQQGMQPGIQEQAGGQMGGMQSQQQVSQMGLQDALTPEMATALEAFADAEDACEWCAEACIASGDPHMMECIRLCRDVSDVAGLNQKFLARDSIFGQEAAAVFQRVARECAQECRQHQDAHCQECAQVLDRAVQSVEAMLRSLSGQTSQQAQQTTGMGGGQMSGSQQLGMGGGY